ncbi:MAG: hypothetical protein VX874_24130 [Pseudomonadota bacterium]|nr:hypothetical protein [Pseudomonadota bacterium]
MSDITRPVTVTDWASAGWKVAACTTNPTIAVVASSVARPPDDTALTIRRAPCC